jgi:beta-aspartyl-peptidase (threonine type)
MLPHPVSSAIASGMTETSERRADSAPRWSIAIHGGAGSMRRETMDEAARAAHEAGLRAALDAGRAVLAAGGTALDAVGAAVAVLEDDPLFNAGRGSVFTYNGINELDAAVMDGTTRQAGAVAGVTHVRNPVRLARAVMDHSPHVLLAGPGPRSSRANRGSNWSIPTGSRPRNAGGSCRN